MARYEDLYTHKFTTEGAELLPGAMRRQSTALSQGATDWAAWRGRGLAAIEALSPGVQQLGMSMQGLTRDFITAYREGQAVDNRLVSLATSQGMTTETARSLNMASEDLARKTGFMDDNIKQAAVTLMNWQVPAKDILNLLPLLARQALTTGSSIEDISNAVGKAFSSGNVGMLKRSRISIDDATTAWFKAKMATLDWSDASQVAAFRAKVIEGAMKGIDATAVPLGSNLNTLEGRSRVLGARWDMLQEKMGEGAFAANSYKMRLAELGVQILETNETTAKLGGGVMAIGGDVFKSLGTLGMYAHSYNEIRRFMGMNEVSVKGLRGAKTGLTAATKADAAAELSKAGIAGKEAAALTGVGRAAKGTTAEVLAMSRANSLAAKTMYVPGAGVVGRAGMMAGMRGELNAAAGGVPGIGGMLAAPVGAGGIGAAIGTVTLVAGTAVLGWEVGSAIAKWLEGQTGYQEKAGEQLVDWFTKGTVKSREAEAARPITKESPEVMAARALAAERLGRETPMSGVEKRGRFAEDITHQILPGTLTSGIMEGRYAREDRERQEASRIRAHATPGTTVQQPGGNLTVTVPVTVTVPANQTVTRQGLRNYTNAR